MKKPKYAVVQTLLGGDPDIKKFVLDSIGGGYVLKKPIPIVVSMDGDDYLVEFLEAELATSGESADEAIRWMKSTIVSNYELFKKSRAVLGPLPKRQLGVLEKYLGNKSRAR